MSDELKLESTAGQRAKWMVEAEKLLSETMEGPYSVIVVLLRDLDRLLSATRPATDAECEEMARELMSQYEADNGPWVEIRSCMRRSAALLRRPRTADAAEMRERCAEVADSYSYGNSMIAADIRALPLSPLDTEQAGDRDSICDCDTCREQRGEPLKGGWRHDDLAEGRSS